MQVSEEKLKRVLANIFNINVEGIDDTTSVDSVAQWDSLKHLNLVLALEHEFNITLSTEQTIEILNYPLIKSVLGEHGIQFKD
jgi:acyl carrier protein